MDIYFFSYHAPDPEMIKDLGAPITTQIKGDISNIYSKSNLISFTETLFIGGQRIKASHTILAKSIVIVEAPPILQGDWLAAGVSTLLVPQMKEEPGPWGTILFNYCRLLQVHKIEVATSSWNSTNPDINSAQIVCEKNQQLVNASASFSMANLLQKMGWKPVKHNLAPW